MNDSSFRFTRAVTRKPGTSITAGLRAQNIGTPDLQLILQHHAHYVETLRSTGATVYELPALEAYPDSVFVEDTALCLPELAVLMRPGAPSRAGEVDEMAGTLNTLYERVLSIAGPGHIEGGDILVTAEEVLVGLSARTDQAGVEELSALLAPWNYQVRIVETPPDVLHFKTDCSLLDGTIILSTPRLDASDCFVGYQVIHSGEGEEAAANCVRFNDIVMMPAGFPATATRLQGAGFDVRQIGNSECAKVDGGMSCLSLRC